MHIVSTVICLAVQRFHLPVSTMRQFYRWKRYLELRGFEILVQGWSHGTDTADFIAIDSESGDLVIVFSNASRNVGEGLPDNEADRKAFERLAAAYLSESEYIDVVVRLDVVSLLVISEDRAVVRHHTNAAMRVG